MSGTNDRKAGLKLGRISMKNYKAYRDEVEVDLSRDPRKTITVIHGEMGKGKTTLLGAVYWCLYGQEKSGGAADSDETLINSDAIRLLGIGDSDEVYVEVSLYEDDEIRYKIKRSVRFTKNSESGEALRHASVGGRLPYGIGIEERVEYSEKQRGGGGDWISSTDPSRVNDVIGSIFPEPLSSYFLFDAELLDNFFTAARENHVKNGIEKISGLPLLASAVRHLKKTSEDIMKGIKSVNLEPIENEIHHCHKSEEDSVRKIEVADEEIARHDGEIRAIESYLRDHSEAVIQRIQDQRSDLGEAMRSIDQNLKRHEGKMNEWLLYTNTILQLRGAMSASMDMCNTWEREGRIPVAVSSHALQNILAGDPPVCICGARLGEGSEGRRRIEDLLGKNLAESAVIQSISTGRGHWADMAEDADNAGRDLDELRTVRSELYSAQGDHKSKRKKLLELLETHDVDDVRARSHRLRELGDERDEQLRLKALAEDAMAKNSKVKEIKEREYNMQLKREGKYTSQKNRMRLAQVLGDLLRQCNDELVEDMRDIVAKKTTEYFLKLVPKDDFSRIDISGNYKTAALGHDEKTKSLSAGQSCCLALSYIAAIREIANRNYFMMIDSPLHNISQAERVGIAENLPAFLQGTQITLLVQDQEYTGSIREGLTTTNFIPTCVDAADCPYLSYNLIPCGLEAYCKTAANMPGMPRASRHAPATLPRLAGCRRAVAGLSYGRRRRLRRRVLGCA